MISSFRYYMKKEILYIDLTVVPYWLARLLDLHVQYCGDDVMCHDANATHVEPPSAFPRPCCIPCSCLSTCGAEQNCCPSVNNPVPQAIQSSNAEKPKEDNAFVTTHNSQNDEHEWSQKGTDLKLEKQVCDRRVEEPLQHMEWNMNKTPYHQRRYLAQHAQKVLIRNLTVITTLKLSV